MKEIMFFICALLFVSAAAGAQDTTDLMSQLEKEAVKNDAGATHYTTATFKTTRLINGHSVENAAKGVMDVKISHRFGKINGGAYELFGLDNATMRMGIDYGINRYLMVGIGRSTFQKTIDAFLKLKILRQSSGKRNMPITLSYVPTVALKTQKFADPERKNYFSSRLVYSHQIIIGRKFSEKTSLQLMPSFTHVNIVQLQKNSNDLFAIGVGGRQKLTKRVSINAEYYYQLPGYKLTGTTNSLSLGFDIETGGHVFQLHFTNSQGMSEHTFINQTTGSWEKGDILFGFNISRVFTIGKSR
jgi:opacity protein-like surface antigen